MHESELKSPMDGFGDWFCEEIEIEILLQKTACKLEIQGPEMPTYARLRWDKKQIHEEAGGRNCLGGLIWEAVSCVEGGEGRPDCLRADLAKT